MLSNFVYLSGTLIPNMTSQLESAFGVTKEDDRNVCFLVTIWLEMTTVPVIVDSREGSTGVGQAIVRGVREAQV